MGFPGGLGVKNPPASEGDRRDVSLTPGSGTSPGGGHGNPFQYSCLGSLKDRGAWRAAAHGVRKSQTCPLGQGEQEGGGRAPPLKEGHCPRAQQKPTRIK